MRARTCNNLRWMLCVLSAAQLLLVSGGPAVAQDAEGDVPALQEPRPSGELRTVQQLQDAIFSKMEYDQQYFSKILSLQAKGRKPPQLTPQVFAQEARRARNNLPVLQRFAEQRQRFLAGEPFGLPPRKDLHQVYTNLIAILNLAQASQKGDWATAAHFGSKVVVSERTSLGLVRGETADYYVRLYRHYFYLMASVNYHQGKDTDAVRWLARLEADSDLQGLKKEIAAEPPVEAESRALRLEKLRTQSLAVMPLENLARRTELDWLSRGLMEVFTSDLSQHADLFVVERGQLDKVMREAKLEMLGVTESGKVADLGKVLGAGTLLVGSYQPGGAGFQLSLRLVAAADGEILSAATGEVKEASLFSEARALLLQLFEPIDWVDAVAQSELRAARAPRTEVVRDLMQARLLLATKADEAKALYARALREDPVFARRFESLKAEFADVSAAVAVMPFVNVSGNAADEWMTRGAVEALQGDLPRLDFTVVERANLAAVLKVRKEHEILDTGSALALGKQVGADLAVLGSVLHQAPQVRVDARFVDIRTGVILFTASGEDRGGDFMACLLTLSRQIAEHLNTRLSEETLEQLAGKKMSTAEFEKYVRAQLAKESLHTAQPAAVASPKEPEKPGPSRAGFWVSVATAASGAALAGIGISLSLAYKEDVAYYDVLQTLATSDQKKTEYASERDKSADRAGIWSIAGYAGVGVTAAALIYLLIDELLLKPGPEGESTVRVVPGGAQVAF